MPLRCGGVGREGAQEPLFRLDPEATELAQLAGLQGCSQGFEAVDAELGMPVEIRAAP